MTALYDGPTITTWTVPTPPKPINLGTLNAPPAGGELVLYQPPIYPPTPLPTIPWHVRFTEYCIDGRGAIHAIVAGWVGLAGVTLYFFVSAIAVAIHSIIAALPAIGGILCAIILAYIILRSGTKDDDVLVLKGCNNGPTPGSHRVKLCNGRHR